MELEIALERSFQWMKESNALIDGMTFDSSTRLRVSLGLQHLCLEHQKGIHTLVKYGVIGSAFALIRPQFESYVRGVWYRLCATDNQVGAFTRGKKPPPIDDLIKDIETLPGFERGYLSDGKKSTWKLFNDFTHGGAMQVVARLSRDEIISNYRINDIAVILDVAASQSLQAALEMAMAASFAQLAEDVLSAYTRIYEVKSE